MNVNKFNKIVIVSLCETFSNDIANLLSQDLGMLFCGTKELVEYELIDKQALEEKCSVAYLKKLEKNVIKQIASFENVCVSISYEYLVQNATLFKKNSLIVFIDLPKTYIKKNSTVDFLDFENRQAKLKELATCVVFVHKVDVTFVKNKILNTLGGIL